MVRKSKGRHRRTREKFRKSPRDKFTVTRYLQKFEIGERVSIVIDPSSQSKPFRRFYGRIGRVIGKRGRAYIVEIKDGDAIKQVITTPEHLKRV
ncbi:MAG: 50S ribosomal protein L21e [Candidatus Micrarchaeota archaeon]|nr:50S ribosomal protein L21e [Candidatus Micrarchaeota archaeon]